MKPPTLLAAPLYLWALVNTLIGLVFAVWGKPMHARWVSGALVIQVKRIAGGKWIMGQTHGCVVLTRERSNPPLLVHEFVHVKQQLVLGLIFYLWYGAEYAAHRAWRLNHSEAYRQIWFEKVAYRVQSEFTAGMRPGAWGS